MNKNVCFLGGLFPYEHRKDIINNHRSVIQYAADALQWGFVDGLKDIFGKATVVNLPYISSFPFGYKEIGSRNSSFGKEQNIDGRNIRFCNLIGYKYYSRYKNAKKALRKWTKESTHNRLILIYAMSVDFVYAATDLKKEFSDLEVLLIVPDLPEYMSESESFIYKAYKRLMDYLMNKRFSDIDYFVLLSKYMADKLNIGERPWIVIEGIYNAKGIESKKHDNAKKIIFYAGTLARRYGIVVLLDAFAKTSNPNYQLMICGDGEMKDEIIERVKSDKRIVFCGQVDRNLALQYEVQASLLVNPRANTGEFTKYSFPSKTMEYLASGTPSLICRLPGIPDEYYDYCYWLDDMSEDSLYQKIEEIFSKDNKELMELGHNAREFILEYKNPKSQCIKIIGMVSK